MRNLDRLVLLCIIVMVYVLFFVVFLPSINEYFGYIYAGLVDCVANGG